MCYLAFASWNASAKLCGFDTEAWTGPTTSHEMNLHNNANQLTCILNDVYQIFSELTYDDSGMPNAYLTLTSQLKRNRYRQSESSRQGLGILYLNSAVTKSLQSRVAV